MSNLQNDIIAEDLFERLEFLGRGMNEPTYTDKQQALLRQLAEGDFEGAQAFVIEMEQQYSTDAMISAEKDRMALLEEPRIDYDSVY